MNTGPLFLMAVTACLHSRPSCGTDELDEINSFVQAVLAVADRNKLGLPEVSQPVKHYALTADGRLAPELQQYLERLVSVSSDVEKPKLVDMLWDDSVAVDEEREPCDVFDQWRNGRNGAGGKHKAVEMSSSTVYVL